MTTALGSMMSMMPKGTSLSDSDKIVEMMININWLMQAAGIVMGAKVPIVLTSRADPPEARLAAAAIAVIVSAKSKGN